MSQRKNKRALRSTNQPRLRLEPLEDRSLLAVAAFAVHFFQDDGGVPGEPLADDTVEVGEPFFAQIVVREHHPGFSGFTSVFLDVAWDADVMKMAEPFDPRQIVTSNLPMFVGGQLRQNDVVRAAFTSSDERIKNVDRIVGLGGTASVASRVGQPIGSDGDDRFVKLALRGASTTDGHFAWLHFRAERAGEIFLEMEQSGLGITPLPATSLGSSQILFASPTIKVIEAETPDPNEPSDPNEQLDDPSEDPPPAPIWHNAALPSDVDGSGRVTPTDAMIVVNFLNANPGYGLLPNAQTTPPQYVDVNDDGRCTPEDVAIVINFLNGRSVSPGEGEHGSTAVSVRATSVVRSSTVVSPAPELRQLAVSAEGEGEGQLFTDFGVRRDGQTVPSVAEAMASSSPEQSRSTPITRPPLTDIGLRSDSPTLPDARRGGLTVTPSQTGNKAAAGISAPSPDDARRADAVFLAGRLAETVWSDLEDILPDVTTGWLPTACTPVEPKLMNGLVKS